MAIIFEGFVPHYTHSDEYKEAVRLMRAQLRKVETRRRRVYGEKTTKRRKSRAKGSDEADSASPEDA